MGGVSQAGAPVGPPGPRVVQNERLLTNRLTGGVLR
jgi:hypothetical protein